MAVEKSKPLLPTPHVDISQTSGAKEAGQERRPTKGFHVDKVQEQPELLGGDRGWKSGYLWQQMGEGQPGKLLAGKMSYFDVDGDYTGIFMDKKIEFYT